MCIDVLQTKYNFVTDNQATKKTSIPFGQAVARMH